MSNRHGKAYSNMFINNYLYLTNNKLNPSPFSFFLITSDKKDKIKNPNFKGIGKLIEIISNKGNIILEKTRKILKFFIFEKFLNLVFLKGMITSLNINKHLYSKKLFCEIPQFNKPYLGCSIRSNEEGTQGMKVLMIKSDSPAEKAGLKVKDIIVEINGKKIRNINEYNAAVGLEAGKKRIKIVRKEADKEEEIEFYVDFILTE